MFLNSKQQDQLNKVKQTYYDKPEVVFMDVVWSNEYFIDGFLDCISTIADTFEKDSKEG